MSNDTKKPQPKSSKPDITPKPLKMTTQTREKPEKSTSNGKLKMTSLHDSYNHKSDKPQLDG